MKFLENKILEYLCNKIQWKSSAASNSVGKIGDCCRIVSRRSPRRSWLLRDDPLVVADFFKKIPRRSWLWLPSLLLWREPRASLGRPSPALTIGHSDSSIRWGVFFIAICILFIIIIIIEGDTHHTVDLICPSLNQPVLWGANPVWSSRRGGIW